MTSHIASLLSFKKNTTIDKIIAPLTRILNELESFASAQEKLSAASATSAAKLQEKANEERASAEQARVLASRYSALTLPVAAE